MILIELDEDILVNIYNYLYYIDIISNFKLTSRTFININNYIKRLYFDTLNGINNFIFLESFPSIIELNLSCLKLNEKSLNLSKNYKLEIINFYGTQINYLKPIEKCVNLKNIDISFTDIDDLSPLSNMLNLEEISLYATYVSNLEPIKNCIKLKKLNLSELIGESIDLSFLKNCKLITEIRLRNTNFINLSYFKYLVNLEIIDLSETGLSNYELWQLKNCLKLKRIYLHDNYELTDLSGLSDCSELNTIDLWNCKNITTISPLKHCLKLKYLNLDGTNIKDISVLSECKYLEKIYIKFDEELCYKNLVNSPYLLINYNTINDLL